MSNAVRLASTEGRGLRMGSLSNEGRGIRLAELQELQERTRRRGKKMLPRPKGEDIEKQN